MTAPPSDGAAPPAGSGQEGEAAAELRATIRGDHAAMKKWYNDDPGKSLPAIARLHESHGPYPAFAADVEAGWSGWRDARRHYLTYTEMGPDAFKEEAAPAPPTPERRKRRSRWASAPPEGAVPAPPARRRRSRWATAPTEGAVLAAPPGGGEILPGLPSSLTLDQMRELSKIQAELRAVHDRLENLDVDAARVDALPRGHADRSQSPPPVYGMDGRRLNTRNMRWRERYENERADLMEKIMEVNPSFRVPGGYVRRKRQRKIFVPVREHPTYNFIGLIIGPRGKTQKEMEEKTNCKIAIRGRGSVKEGARGRRDGKPMEGENEDLHVVVTGETQADVDKAAGLVQEMLVVIDDDKNEHKQAQLRELALLNGTLKEDDYCQFCAERGHRAFECPKRFAAASAGRAAAQVRCAICGDTSHPTRDCTQSKCIVKDEKQLDSAYQSFMAELDGKDGAEAAASASAAAAAAAAGEICRNVGAEPMTAEEIIAAVQQARGAESEAPQVFDFTDVKTVPGATAGVDGALATDEASSPPEVFDLSNLSKLKESVEAARKAEEEAAEAAANAPVAPGSEAAAVPGEDPGPSLTAAAATAALAGQAAATATPAGYPPGYPPGYSPAGTAGVQPAPMAGGYPSYEQYGPQGAGPYGPSAGGWPPGQQNYYGYPQGDAPGQPQQPQQGTGTWDYQSFYQGENMDAAVNWWD